MHSVYVDTLISAARTILDANTEHITKSGLGYSSNLLWHVCTLWRTRSAVESKSNPYLLLL